MGFDYREKVLQLIKYRPQLSSAVAKSLGVNTIIAGAMLSEMVSKKVLRVSNLKIGSSPLYYLPQNEAMLEEFKDNLDEKSLRAFDIIRERRVVRDSDQSPLVRVCLKQIKDFAKPLEVTYNGRTELFYKWFLLSDAQAKEIISSILNPDDLVVQGHMSGDIADARRVGAVSAVGGAPDAAASDEGAQAVQETVSAAPVRARPVRKVQQKLNKESVPEPVSEAPKVERVELAVPAREEQQPL